jgi:hypothetical protein
MISLDDFRRRVSAEMRALPEEATVAEVDAAINRAIADGQPRGGSIEGLLFQRGRAEAREARAREAGASKAS